MPKELIEDDRLFPRSEYYSRFEGTTAFVMTDPDYWGTYHRSVSTRFSREVAGQNGTKFTSHCATKPKSNANSFHAHTGSILSPFSKNYYREVVELAEQVSEYNINVRDKLLLYKRAMAEAVLSSFVKEADDNSQKIKQGRSKNHIFRPIVIYENDYPCILVSLPVLNPAEAKSKAAAYWSKHPKPFQRLLLASFISILNVEATKANIPIEMVMRASFGHNLPSICETDNTFRINVGVIPESYAKLIGKALEQLNSTFNELTDESTQETPFDKKFLTKVRHYNVNKLKIAINKKDCYKELRNIDEYKNAEKSDQSFEKLYEKFCKINKEKKTLKSEK